MKFIKKFIFIVLVLVLLVYLSIIFLLGPVINKTTATLGPEVLDVEVEVQDVNVSPLLNSCTIEGVTVGNPKCDGDNAWKSDYAFKMGKLDVSYVLSSVTSDQLIIDEFVVDGAEVMYETSAMSFRGMPAGSNLEHLKMNIDKLLGPAKEGEKGRTGKKVWIKKFIFKNAKVHVRSTALGGIGVPLSIADIELDDIGKGGEDKTIGEAFMLIYSKILSDLGGLVN